MMRHARFLPAVLPVLGLLGCAAPDAGSRAFVASADAGAAGGGQLSLRPLARLPAEAGRIVAIRRSGDSGQTQEIVFPGSDGVPGENKVTLTIGHLGSGMTADDRAATSRPTQAAIDADLATLFPGIAMSLSPTALTSPAGPLSYATGTRGATSCLYAWQSTGPSKIGLVEGITGEAPPSMRLRLRLCREASPARVRAMAAGLTIDVAGGSARTDDLATTGEPLVAADAPAPVEAVDARQARHARRAPVHKHRAAQRTHHEPRRIAHQNNARAVTAAGDIPLPDDLAPARPTPAVVSAKATPSAPRSTLADLPMPSR